MMNKLPSTSIGKLLIEVCLISARGLPRSSFLKPQWYAVSWIDPNNKYCTKIDTSGCQNPVWKTKFTHFIDTSTESDLQDTELHIEVYSREPLFLREKLQGTASVNLKEFLGKYSKKGERFKEGSEDVGSFQLRKKNGKPQGFVDVSIRISEEKEGTASFFNLRNEDGFNLKDGSHVFTMATNGGPMQAHQPGQTEPPFYPPGNPRQPISIQDRPYTHPMPYPANYSNPAVAGSSHPTNVSRPNHPGYPPPPPSYVGYGPTFIPRGNDPSILSSYINMPSSGAGRGGGPGLGVGLGAGALAAGAVMFGDDLMSGFQLPNAAMRDASLTIATDPFF